MEQERMPHQPILPLEPFQKCGLDFVRPFKLAAARNGNKYIIVATDYCTKWVKAKGLHYNTAASTEKFVYEHLWCHFGCPIELISDQVGHFLNHIIRELTMHYAVVHKKSTPYYPQVNGLAESKNKYCKPSSKRSLTRTTPAGMTNYTVHYGHIGPDSKSTFNPPPFE
mgnify:CR=1 FL=1